MRGLLLGLAGSLCLMVSLALFVYYFSSDSDGDDTTWRS